MEVFIFINNVLLVGMVFFKILDRNVCKFCLVILVCFGFCYCGSKVWLVNDIMW